MGLGALFEAVGTLLMNYSFREVLLTDYCAGYGGRLMLHNDPFSDSGFKLQIVLLTFAPAFLAAGIYLNLKHL